MTQSTTTKEQQFKAARFMAQMLGNQNLIDALDDGRQFRWRPLEDISAYELALCLYLAPLVMTNERFEVQAKMFDALPAEAQRHFQVLSMHDES